MGVRQPQAGSKNLWLRNGPFIPSYDACLPSRHPWPFPAHQKAVSSFSDNCVCGMYMPVEQRISGRRCNFATKLVANPLSRGPDDEEGMVQPSR